MRKTLLAAGLILAGVGTRARAGTAETGSGERAEVPARLADGQAGLDLLAKAALESYRRLAEDVQGKIDAPGADDDFLDGNPRDGIAFDEAERGRLNELVERYRAMRERMFPEERVTPDDVFSKLDPDYFDELSRRASRLKWGGDGERGLTGRLQDAADAGSPLAQYYSWQLQGVYLLQRVWGAATGGERLSGQAPIFTLPLIR